MSSKSSRRRAREFALQGIYQWLLSGNGVALIEEHLEQASGFDKADRELFVSLLRGTLDNVAELQNVFAPFIDRPLSELSPVERSILLLATHELMRCPQTPYRVIINEAIELAKGYGAADGHRFVNGVLDKLAAQLRAAEIAALMRERQG